MNREQVRDMDIYLTSTIVQPFIDGFKYAGCDDPPTVQELLKKGKVNYRGISIKKYSDMFRIWRGRNSSLDDIVTAASISKADSKSFYEKMMCLFKGWKKGNSYPIEVSKEVDSKVKKSYITHMDSEDVQGMRFDELITKEVTFDYICEVLASCRNRNDVGLARTILNRMREIIDHDAIFNKEES